MEDVERTRNNVKLLNELLTHVQGNSGEQERLLVEELYKSIGELRPKILRLASELTGNEEGMLDIFQTNDSVLRVMDLYTNKMASLPPLPSSKGAASVGSNSTGVGSNSTERKVSLDFGSVFGDSADVLEMFSGHPSDEAEFLGPVRGVRIAPVTGGVGGVQPAKVEPGGVIWPESGVVEYHDVIHLSGGAQYSPLNKGFPIISDALSTQQKQFIPQAPAGISSSPTQSGPLLSGITSSPITIPPPQQQAAKEKITSTQHVSSMIGTASSADPGFGSWQHVEKTTPSATPPAPEGNKPSSPGAALPAVLDSVEMTKPNMSGSDLPVSCSLSPALSGAKKPKMGCEDDDFIEEVEEAIVKDKLIDRKLAHSIFIGPPGSGKSSLMDRLVRRMRKLFSSSTGVSESIVVVDVKVPSSFHSVTVVDSDTWKEVKYDLSLVRQMDTKSFIESECVLPQGMGNGLPSSSTADTPAPSMLPEAAKSTLLAGKAQPVSKPSNKKIREAIRGVLKECGGYKEFRDSYSKSFSLYMRDTGGHMAFQEMLSVLILGPAIFIFVFRVDVDIKKKFKVDYRVSSERSLNCTTSSISTEEALLQCLASVYAMDTSGKAGVETHKPMVFIIGTHKDKLGASADKKIAKLNEHLDSLIDSYQDLVQYADWDEGEVMFTVDNTSESDEDFKLIRSKLYSFISERSEFTIQFPVSYLLFALELQHEKRSVLSFDKCKGIAAKYGIVGDRVSDLLQFLHFRVGVIQYFKFEGLVMVKPQVLFSKVTELVKKTFSHKSLTSKEKRDFQKGILTESLIREVVGDSEIDSEKFLKLLVRLHLVTPFTLPGDKERKYFLPCVLNHIEEANVEDTESDAMPLYVQFRCKHCPKGLFSVLVTHLMTAKDGQVSFSLIQDKIFRDRISFEVHSDVADQDEISLRAFSSHLEIKFYPSRSLYEDRTSAIAKACSAARLEIETSIAKSLDYLGYNSGRVCPIMCFKCYACRELHQVKKAKGMPCKIYCDRFRTTDRIPARGRCWFNEDASSKSKLSSKASPAFCISEAGLSELDIPSLCEQLRPHASKWREIGMGLRFTASELFTIQASPAHFANAPSSYLEAMLAIWQQWAPGDARGSKNYATLELLKTAVDRAGLGRVAEELHLD